MALKVFKNLKDEFLELHISTRILLIALVVLFLIPALLSIISFTFTGFKHNALSDLLGIYLDHGVLYSFGFIILANCISFIFEKKKLLPFILLLITLTITLWLLSNWLWIIFIGLFITFIGLKIIQLISKKEKLLDITLLKEDFNNYCTITHWNIFVAGILIANFLILYNFKYLPSLCFLSSQIIIIIGTVLFIIISIVSLFKDQRKILPLVFVMISLIPITILMLLFICIYSFFGGLGELSQFI